MGYQTSSQGPVGHLPEKGAGAALLGFGALGLLAFFVSSVVAVFAASSTAGGAVILVVAVIAILAIATYRKRQKVTASLVLLGLAALWVVLGGVIVFKNHWLAFTPAAWVLNALFIAALVSGAWSTIKTWLRIIAGLLAVSLVIATAVFPRPPDGDGPFDTAEEWRIDVEVKDDTGEPLQSALVLCGAVMNWESKLGLAATLARETDSNGRIPTWEFKEDPRLKIVICSAWKNANDGNAGYPPMTKFVFSIAGGDKYKLDFALVENPHPDIAFLTFNLSGDYEQPWYYLDFQLWAGEPVGYFGSRDSSAQPLQTKSWNELHGNGFAIPAATATRDLHLRYRYEGPDGKELGPPYSETRTFHFGAIAPGTRKRLSLRIPNR